MSLMLSPMSNFTVNFQAMGSRIQAWLNVSDPAAAQILAQMPAWFEAWEAALSRFRPTSELARLNAQAGEWVYVSDLMFTVITHSLEAAALTDGLVNPLILPALEAAGYDHSFVPETFIPGEGGGFSTVLDTAPDTVPNWRTIQLDQAARAVRLPRGGRLDLGGIAKGWAAQQAADYLSQTGPCLVDAGGDMVARGAPDDSGGWLVSIPQPASEKTAPLPPILLCNAAIATSGSDYRRWSRHGQTLHHLIDPRTGQPATSAVRSATVTAAEATHAEAWAKAALIADRLPDLPAYLVYNDGSTTLNPAFSELWSESPCNVNR